MSEEQGGGLTESQIMAELVAILDQLNTLPSDAFSERADLRQRHYTLKHELAELQVDDRKALQKEWAEQAAAKDDSPQTGLITNASAGADGSVGL